MSEADGPVDGRTARALRTHESIVDACISLVEDGDLRPTAPRIADFTLQRTRLLEAITPVRRAANVHAPFSHEVTSRLQAGHDFLRSEVERVFATELTALEPAARTIRLDALDVTLSWPTWESLRALGGRSIEEARAVLTQMLEATLRE